GDLAALVSRVPLADYDDEQLREHLNDIEWVERTARAHEVVLEQALEDCTIVPLRLCTLFRGLERVRDFLRDEHDGLTAGLAALTGRAEWGLKLFVDEERLRDSLTGPDATATEAGAGYLDRKQRERDERQARADLIAYFAKGRTSTWRQSRTPRARIR